MRLQTLAEQGRIAMLPEWPDSCPGRLVRPEDWKIYRKTETSNRFSM